LEDIAISTIKLQLIRGGEVGLFLTIYTPNLSIYPRKAKNKLEERKKGGESN